MKQQVTYTTDKIPPQALDIEKVVIGALMTEPNAIQRVESLTADDFYSEVHKTIFRAIRNLADRRRAVDMLTTTNELKAMGELDNVGGAYFVTEMCMGVGSAAHLSEHANILKQKALARKLISMSTEVQEMSYNQMTDIGDVFEFIEKRITDLTIGAQKSEASTMDESLSDTIDYIQKIQYNAEHGIKNSVETGLYEMTKHFNGGWAAPDLIILGGRPSMGKALRMDAKILTPNGWVLNKNIKVGDDVASIDGEKSNVIGVFPQGVKPMYRVNFIDGRSTVCSGDHLWEIRSSKWNKSKILTTTDVMSKLKLKRYQNRLYIPMFNGDFGSEKDFVIHPYLLGVLLGDGSFKDGICWDKPNSQIVERVVSYGYSVKSDGMRNRISFPLGQGNPLLKEIDRLGLRPTKSATKFIPEEYKFANRSQRLDLFNGLLDTDGGIDKNGVVEYCTVSEKLASDFQWLAWSLGYRCSKNKGKSFFNGVRHKDRYRMVVSNNGACDNLFTNEERSSRFSNKKRSKSPTITSIEYVGEEECQCISVSHPKRLFVTDDFVLTHNTQAAIHFAKNAAMDGKKPLFISIEMTKIQLVLRMITENNAIDFYKIKTGQLSPEEWRLVDEAIAKISQMEMRIADDNNIQYLGNIKSLARSYARKGELGMIIIDYLQLIRTGMSFGTRDLEIGYITRELKALAKELNVPIMLLAQLNRGIKGAKVTCPKLEDLRESGNIEQDADIVIFIHRPSYYDNEAIDDNGDTWNLRGYFYIAKYREGERDAKIYFEHDEYFKKIIDPTNVYTPMKRNYMPQEDDGVAF